MMGNVWVHASLWILRYECFIDIPYVKHCHVDAATLDNFRSTKKNKKKLIAYDHSIAINVLLSQVYSSL